MKYFKLVVVVALLTFIAGCANLRNQGVAVDEGGKVSSYNNLDRHGAIALFESQQGQACYDTIKEAIQFSLAPESSPDFVGPPKPKVTTVYDAMIAQSEAMKEMTDSFMKNTADIVAYSNGITPQDPLVQLAALCKRNNYYDMKMATSANRHATLQSISSDVTEFFGGATPFAALAYLGSKSGNNYDISGNNNATDGDRNAVSIPTTVKPEVVVVETEVVVFPPTEPIPEPEL